MQKFLNYDGLQSLTGKIQENYLPRGNGVFLLQHDTRNHIERFVVPEFWAANAQQGTCCGVVVQVAGKIYVLAPVQVSLPWATSSQLVGAAVSNYFDAMLDLDGKAKTAAIVSRFGSGSGYAAGYCNAYGNGAIEAGKWWLGSAGEWMEIGTMRAGVLKAYEMLGVSFGGSQNSSTEYSSSNFWYAQAMLDWCQQISRWRPKTTNGPTTPITRLR